MTEPTKWLTLADAAAALGTTPDRLRYKARRGLHPTRHSGKADRSLYAVKGAPTAKPLKGRKRKVKPLLSMPSAPKGSVWRVAILSDVHVPDQDMPTWLAVLCWLRENQPDEIILLGDFGEFASMSMHGADDVASLRSDVEAVRQALEIIRSACPDSQILLFEGNHETRLKRTAMARLPAVASVLDLPTLLELDGLDVAWVPEANQLRRGGLRLVHGSLASTHSAKAHLDRYGYSVATGHVHRPQMFTSVDGEGELRVGYTLPCMRTLDPHWLNGRPSQWANGFATLDVDDRGDWNLFSILIKGGRFRYHGEVYDGANWDA